MPRTPLFNSLQRLARTAATTNAGPHCIDRRTFLTGAAALPLAGAFTKPATARARTERVAIVGAGISGLMAALTLQEAGFAPRVFEASGRSGGRVHTNRAGWFGEQTAEWCGELIDSSHVTMIALAKRFGLTLTDVLASTAHAAQYTILIDGSYYPVAQAARDFHPVYKQLAQQLRAAGDLVPYDRLNAEQRRIDGLSVYAWIERYVPGGHQSRMGRYLERAYLAEFGRETREQSAINLLYMLGTQSGPVEGEAGFHIFGPSDERYHINGGNERLTDAIAARLQPGTIELNTRLVAIAREPGARIRLTLVASNGRREEHFERVVLALPFTRLRHVDRSAARLSAVKERAIRELGYGHHTKMHVPFKQRVWRDSGAWPGTSDGTVYTDLGFQNTWDTTRGQPGDRGILVAYLGGSAALAAAADTAYSTTLESPKTQRSVTTFLAQIEHVFPGITQQYAGHATMGSTFLDPDIGGSYSVWLVGQLTAFGGAEGRAEGAIHFAGEHTSLDQQGYMEGGASTGLRVAREIMQALNTRSTQSA